MLFNKFICIFRRVKVKTFFPLKPSTNSCEKNKEIRKLTEKSIWMAKPQIFKSLSGNRLFWRKKLTVENKNKMNMLKENSEKL